MYPLTHIHITANSAGNHPLVLFASMLPDMPIITDYVSWENFRGIQPWHKSIKNRDLKVGLVMHSAADAVSHGILDNPASKQEGYVIKWISKRFPKLSYGGVAHHMAEVFLELYVAKQYPYVFDLLAKSINFASRPEIATIIAAELSNGLKKDYGRIHKLISKYILTLYGLSKMARAFSRFGNPEQGREECLREAIAACRSVLI